MDNQEILSILEGYPDYKDSFEDQDKVVDENYVMYIIINGSVKMQKGKIASQVGHAVHKLIEYLVSKKPKILKKYNNNCCPKIVLKTDDVYELIRIMDSTKNIFKTYVVDEGRTQIKKDTLTAIGYIFRDDMIPKCISSLKLV